MKYINTKDFSEKVSFRQATLQGLASQKGLFVPESLPKLTSSFFDTIEQLSDIEIAYEAIFPFVKDSLTEVQLRTILEGTLSFLIPVVAIQENIFTLELFHGPTQAFKDVGVRFMARCFSQFVDKENEVTVLVATSGDTGSAVAHGFFEVEGVQAKVLFPKGKISPYQEYQITSLGKNIQAIEVEGTFDDCQTLVKQAFSDVALNKKIPLTSANSINIARLLPQMIYYFLAYKQLKHKLNNKKWLVSVPSGNFGNLTAGLYAKKMGLPVEQFIAATNANDTFLKYWETGVYNPKPSIPTYSNAMDVGAPSNFERMMYLYQQAHEVLKKDILADSRSDEHTLTEMKSIYKKYNYMLDPHGAVGLLALKKYLEEDSIGLFLETAHPKKFETVVKKAIPGFDTTTVNLAYCQKTSIPNRYTDFLEVLTS